MNSLRSVCRIMLPAVSIGVALVVYMMAYRCIGVRCTSPRSALQVFEHEWQAHAFEPAAKIESAVTHSLIENAWDID